MQLGVLQLAAGLDATAEVIAQADEWHWRYVEQGDEYGKGNTEWYLERAYAQLLIMAEAIELPVLRRAIARDLRSARKDGLITTETDPDGNPDLKWASPARRYLAALRATFGVEGSRTVTKDVEAILHAATYSINDSRVYGGPPRDEKSVHLRLENLLRCVFPDFLHKPRLSKAIKSFEPDTGLPSIHTLVEYKFLSSASQVGQVADELLADTRGYTAPDWSSFIYVIYETHRFRPESEWRQLLRDSDIDLRTTVVVITGEPTSGSRRGRGGSNSLPEKPSAKRPRNRGTK